MSTAKTQLEYQYERLGTLEKTGVDVMIIGAGINGAGVFRDLCKQGISCLIVDRADFGSGTSAAPSRLIHGGLKYLETGEFGLVAQSTYERNLLLKNAPHCVEPLKTVIPIFSWAKGIGPAVKTLFGQKATARSRGALLIKAGLFLYDLYGARQRVMPRHSLWGRARALREIPGLTPRIVAAGTYYDAKISRPERLVWELIQDGLAANQSSGAMNYVGVTARQDGNIKLSCANGTAFNIQPRLVINAAGPWIDGVNAILGEPTNLIGGTKGSHIILDHAKLLQQLNGRMIYFEADDGRILLVYPYENRVMVGSTDERADNPDQVTCEDWEVDYFLESLRGLLPVMTFDRSQIVYAYSGIRPLPLSETQSEGLISRDHSAPVLEPSTIRQFPILSLVGGKWTTFRGFAEEASDLVLDRLGAKRKISTASLAIGGGKDFPRSQSERTTWLSKFSNAPWAEKLLLRYGTTATEIANDPGNGESLQDAPDYLLGEFEWIARNEMVQSLGDVILRRTVLGLGGKLSLGDLQRIAYVVGMTLGWSRNRCDSELEKLSEVLSARHRIRFAGASDFSEKKTGTGQ